jgi:hypothetical protein
MMNDQTSPTAGGQRPEPPRRDPFAAPPDARDLPPVPEPGVAGGHGAGEGLGHDAEPVNDMFPGHHAVTGNGAVPGHAGHGGHDGHDHGAHGHAPGDVPVWGAAFPPPRLPARKKSSPRDWLRIARPDIEVGAVIAGLGVLLGLLGGMAWYRFSPTVWMSIPADAVAQVKDGVDQSALLVSPEGKGIASVDGYFFIVTAVAGVLLGTAAFLLARRGLRPVRGRKTENQDGAGVGAWAGLLVGGLLATTVTAALGRWISMPDPIVLLRKIAAGEKFHAVVALHAQGLYLVAPILGLVWFTALTAAFTKPAPPARWVPYGERPAPGYFTTDNPYGLSPTTQAGQAAPTTAPTQGAGQWPASGEQQHPQD